MAKNEENKAIVPITSSYAIANVDRAEIQDAINTIQELNLTMHQLKAIHCPKGGDVWNVTGIDDETWTGKTLTCIPLYAVSYRGYYGPEAETDEEVKPPECSAVGQEEKCINCQHDIFYTDPKTGRGMKDCKEKIALFVMRDCDVLPAVLRVSTKAMKLWRNFAKDLLVGKALPYHRVMMDVTLSSEKEGRFEYSLPHFRVNRRLTPEECAILTDYRTFCQQIAEASKWTEMAPVVVDSEVPGPTTNSGADTPPPVTDDDCPF